MFGPVDGEAQGRNGDPLQHRVAARQRPQCEQHQHGSDQVRLQWGKVREGREEEGVLGSAETAGQTALSAGCRAGMPHYGGGETAKMT